MANHDVRERRLPGRVLFALGACILAFLPHAASAQAAYPPCNDHSSALALLENRYREVPIAAGVTNGGGLVQVIAQADGGTWTIIVTDPNGLTCLIAAGEGWRTVVPKVIGPDS